MAHIKEEEEAAANLVVHYWNQHLGKAGKPGSVSSTGMEVITFLLTNQVNQANHRCFQSQLVYPGRPGSSSELLGWVEDRARLAGRQNQ